MNIIIMLRMKFSISRYCPPASHPASFSASLPTLFCPQVPFPLPSPNIRFIFFLPWKIIHFSLEIQIKKKKKSWFIDLAVRLFFRLKNFLNYFGFEFSVKKKKNSIIRKSHLHLNLFEGLYFWTRRQYEGVNPLDPLLFWKVFNYWWQYRSQSP